MKRSPLLLLASAAFVVACGGSDGPTSDGTASAVGTKPETDPAKAAESCTATFRWLQKDAYKNTGGRTSSAWPPHTTTQLDVRCVDAKGNETFSTSAFRENHGSKPGQLDANGKPLLDEVRHTDATGTRDQVLALVDSYKGCECDPTTQFLSMDVAKEDVSMQKILAGFADYTSAHLGCSGGVTTQDVVGKLQSGDFEGALAGFQSCEWASGYGWLDGLTQSAKGVLPDLSAYHVCNNDAKLEAALFAQFTTNGTAPACDSTSDVCKGPAFFYQP
jgi:hypothetical protein